MHSPVSPLELVFNDLPGALCVAGRPSQFGPSYFSQEAALVAGAIPERQLQFLSARGAAHQLLDRLDQVRAPLLAAGNGAPDWPEGIAGSLSHCRDQVAAAVALRRRWKGLGIDVEPDVPLPEDAHSMVMTNADSALLPTLSASVGPGHWARLVFCAKECVHKCLNPLNGAWLEFDEVAIWIDPACGVFAPLPLSDAARAAFSGLRFEGRWLRRDGFLFSILAAT